MSTPEAPEPGYPLAELCVLADLPPRTVRYYIQIGLVDRPQGETRAARYGPRHLECVFHAKLDTDSTASWTVIPRQAGHLFQGKLDT